MTRRCLLLLLPLVPVLVAVPAPLALAAVQPIATAEMNVDGLELDVMSLERKGNVLTLKWAVRNTGTEQQRALFSMVGTGASTYVVDEENGAKYYVLTDKEGQVLASMHEYTESGRYGINQSIDPGETKRFWAKFPAPPPEVSEVTLLFTATEPFEGVAISEKP
jgi:hypothetical protein